MLKELEADEPDEPNNEVTGDQIDAVNARVAQMRRVLRNCTSFADADRKLADRGIASAGRRRILIAKCAPSLWNARMSEAYNGTNA